MNKIYNTTVNAAYGAWREQASYFRQSAVENEIYK